MSAAPGPGPSGHRGWRRPLLRWALQFAVLYGFWLAFSGRLEPQFLILGALSAALVVALTHHLFDSLEPERFEPIPHGKAWFALTVVRFVAYLPWLLFQVLVANLQVAYLLLHPRLPVNPRLIQFHTALRSEPSQVLLAQSITLTPGTITVDVADGRYLIHTLAPSSSRSLESGEMQNKVAAVFGQAPTPPEPVHTITALEDLER